MPTRLAGLSDLAVLASRQGGVITRTQAAAHGVNSVAVRRRVSSGEWSLRFGCVVVAPHPRGEDWRDAWAMGLRCGPTAVVTGPTAVRLGSWQIPDRLALCWCPEAGHVRSTELAVLRDSAPRRARRGPAFRVAHPVDALVDTMLAVTEARAVELLDLVLQRHWLDAASLSALCESRAAPGRAGTARLRALTAAARAGTRSEAEREAARLVRRSGKHRWQANYPLRTRSGQVVAELDFALPELKICIEIDGRAFHSDADSFEQDRARQNALAVDGWLILRFTWWQLTMRPEWVVETIRQAIALRSSGRPAA